MVYDCVDKSLKGLEPQQVSLFSGGLSAAADCSEKRASTFARNIHYQSDWNAECAVASSQQVACEPSRPVESETF